MGFHAFSVDPRTILGVGPAASLEEVHEAYRVKSKKHHPDRGGDEWAFRMVARAYEILKTTAAIPGAAVSGPQEARRPGPGDPGAAGPADWRWRGEPRAGWRGDRAATAGGSWWPHGTGAGSGPVAPEAADPAPAEPEGPHVDPSRFRSVDVELIWTRFEKDGPTRLLEGPDANDATLSVCMVLSWPEADLIEHTPEFPGGAEILRTLIDLFERLRADKAVVAARSRIEDGRFVGWLSYPDVLTAQDAVLTVRDTFRDRGLTIKLQTRDERIPFDWRTETYPLVMSQAS